ncbi:MAG TPA: homoserine O-succinyltransferase [Steroidobacteraceae bacterium]|nr:homoserine O-succinyltransferase [Steroidobacteraceae bacterium]
MPELQVPNVSSSSFTPREPALDAAPLDGAADPSSLDPAAALQPISLPRGYACEEDVLELARQPFELHFGGVLPRVEVAYRLAGVAHAPVVAVLGGISAGRNVFKVRDGVAGWWDEIAGPGKPLDTNRFRVLGIDFLGGSHRTTGPAHGEVFPSVSAYDQARCLVAVLDHLGIETLHGCVGASYGGMVTLVLGAAHATRLRQGVVVSAAHRTHPMSTAWRSVQRNFVRYAIEHGEGERGLALARALAMTTYRSIREFEDRFPGEAERRDGRFVFPVESYIVSRGEAYAKTYRPEAFVCLSESIDLHRVDPARIVVPMTMVAVLEDQLVPVADMRALRDRIGSACQLIEISSVYGHDAFFKEADVLRDVFHNAFD